MSNELESISLETATEKLGHYTRYEKTVEALNSLISANKQIYDMKNGDLAIQLADETIYLPCYILTSQSDVFKTMLTTNMKEQKEKIIDLTMHTPSVVKVLINYLCFREEIEFNINKLPLIFELWNLTEMFQIIKYRDSIKEMLFNNLEKIYDGRFEIMTECTKYPELTKELYTKCIDKLKYAVKNSLESSVEHYEGFTKLPKTAQDNLMDEVFAIMDESYINLDSPVVHLFTKNKKRKLETSL